MKTKMLFSILFFAVSIQTVFAGEVQGKVKELLVRDDGLHWVYIDAVATGKPSCATTTPWMIRDENSTFGKSQFAILLAAQAQGKAVWIRGRNTCTRWGDAEDISYLSIIQ